MRDALVVGRGLLEPTGDRVGGRGGNFSRLPFLGVCMGQWTGKRAKPPGQQAGDPTGGSRT